MLGNVTCVTIVCVRCAVSINVHASTVAPVNAKEKIRPSTILKTSVPIVTKIGLIDDVGDPYLWAKFHYDPMWGFASTRACARRYKWLGYSYFFGFPILYSQAPSTGFHDQYVKWRRFAQGPCSCSILFHKLSPATDFMCEWLLFNPTFGLPKINKRLFVHQPSLLRGTDETTHWLNVLRLMSLSHKTRPATECWTTGSQTINSSYIAEQWSDDDPSNHIVAIHQTSTLDSDDNEIIWLRSVAVKVLAKLNKSVKEIGFFCV